VLWVSPHHPPPPLPPGGEWLGGALGSGLTTGVLERCGVRLSVSCWVCAVVGQMVRSDVALAAGYWHLGAWVVGQ
jgi:hypothetical protein